MVLASLSSIPPELLCQIFQYADDFSFVSALARTARIFYDTWRVNATSICKAVAPRAVSNLADAERLVALQEEAEASRQDDSDYRAILRAKRLLFIARYTSTVCKKYETLAMREWWNSETDDDLPVNPSTRASFEHGLYCVLTIGVMARATHLREQASEFLDMCVPHQLCRFVKLPTWVVHLGENDYGYLDLDFGDETWRAGCDLVANRCRFLLRGFT